MEMDKYTKDLELIFKNDKYALYIDKEAKEVSILNYEIDDLCTILLTDLGNIFFD